mmetsp:Transcript_108913/g.313721  ORF Transcript_108913/g.313721 Transcript_108913/m.313721 type:complete len:651 (-) Transcript_108913:556-2508(-)
MSCRGHRPGAIAVRVALAALLHFKLAASAVATEDLTSAAVAVDILAHGPLLRREPGESTLSTPSFVAVRAGALSSPSAALAAAVDSVVVPPVCDGEVVADTCRLIRRNDKVTEPVTAVTLAQLAAALGFCDGIEAARPVLHELNFQEKLGTPQQWREDMFVDCLDLCMSVEEYFEDGDRFALPPGSDTACYVAGSHGLSCDVVVTPGAVSVQMNKNDYYGKAGDLKVQREAVKQVQWAAEKTQSMRCPFQGEEAVLRVAQLFRYYPRGSQRDFVDTPPAMSAARQQAVYRALATVEVWLSLTLRAMVNQEAVAERQMYFGGEGSQGAAQVRQIVWSVMAFAMREMMGGVHVKMGNNVSCVPGMLGYAWTEREDLPTVIRPNIAGCSSGECGVGPDGRYHVQLCDSAFEQSEADFVSLFLHELVHHAGADDISYSAEMAQKMSQFLQMRNADNYQRFLLEVVTEEVSDSNKERASWEKVAKGFKARREKRKERRARRREKRKDRRDRRKDKRDNRRDRRRGKKVSHKVSNTRSQGKQQGPNANHKASNKVNGQGRKKNSLVNNQVDKKGRQKNKRINNKANNKMNGQARGKGRKKNNRVHMNKENLASMKGSEKTNKAGKAGSMGNKSGRKKHNKAKSKVNMGKKRHKRRT